MSCSSCPSQQNLSLIKQHALNYTNPNNKKAWLSLITSIIYMLLGAWLIAQGHCMLGWLLESLTTMRLFIQFHDMAHFSYFSTVTMNKIVGTVIGVYVHFPFDAWRDGHNYHHKVFGNIDKLDISQTILFTKKQYEQMPTLKRIIARIFRQPVIYFLLTAPFLWFVGLYYQIARKYGVTSKPFLQKSLSMIFVLFVCPRLGISPSWMFFNVYVAEVLGTVLFHLQHSVNMPYRERNDKWEFSQAAIQGSTFLEIPELLKIFTIGIEYHHIHHLNTNVPSYLIRQCHEQFDKKNQQQLNPQNSQKQDKSYKIKNDADKDNSNWDKININRVGYQLALSSLSNVMLDEDKKQLVKFQYKFW